MNVLLVTPDRGQVNAHLRSQSFYVHPFQPDVVLKFEYLADEWGPFAERHGFDINLPMVLHGSERPVWDYRYHEDDYSLSIRKKIRARYFMDFQNFGYC